MTKNKSTPSTGGLALPATTAPLQPLLTPTSPADEALQALRDDLTAQMALQREEMLALQRQMMAQIQAIADRSPPVSAAPATAQLNTNTSLPTPVSAQIASFAALSQPLVQQQLTPPLVLQVSAPLAQPVTTKQHHSSSDKINFELPCDAITRLLAFSPPNCSSNTVETCSVTPPTKQLRPRRATNWKKRKRKVLRFSETLHRSSLTELLPLVVNLKRDSCGGFPEELLNTKHKVLEDAHKVFDENPERDKVTLTTTNQRGCVTKAVKLFTENGSLCDVNNEVEENGKALDGVGETEVIDHFSISDESDCGEEGEGEESSDDEYEFCVGDFVWGKIKHHPWWPGQICDPSDASELAVKLKSRGKLLVAYYGYATFSWCHPSQLKPFEENFMEFSKLSSSGVFVLAVQQAVDEICRLVKLNMSCACMGEEFLSSCSRPLALNAGVKEGVFDLAGRVGDLFVHLFQPSAFLAELKDVAQVTSSTNSLELNALKTLLSTFFILEGGHQLPLYSEPQLIPGLEDDRKMMEVPVKWSSDDRPSFPVGSNTGNAEQVLLQKSPSSIENRLPHKRKKNEDIHINSSDGETNVGKVFVKNLSDGTDNVALPEMFKQFGNVMSCRVAKLEDKLVLKGGVL